MSVLSWAVFTLCAVLVVVRYWATGDSAFLLYAVPALAFLVIIPVALNRMSRRSFMEASRDLDGKVRRAAIGTIGPSRIGEAVRILGTVKKISFKWLNRPHFQIEDDTGRIRVVMFTSPPEAVQVSDRVEALGLVVKNVFSANRTFVSAVSIKKIP